MAKAWKNLRDSLKSPSSRRRSSLNASLRSDLSSDELQNTQISSAGDLGFDRGDKSIGLQLNTGDHFGRPLQLQLGDAEICWEDGQWRTDAGGGGNRDYKELKDLKKKHLAIQEENQLLHYKLDLVLDMLTVANLEIKTMKKDMDAIVRESARTRSR